ncbi:MAG: hypothetical protein NT030_06530 [Candidatus Saganbacteria bacterium]|nr:hypothetical protein [Candidatus Saganbacteria bacterium]
MKGSDSSTNIKTVLNDLNDGRNVSVLHIKNYVGKENPQQPKKEHKTVDLAYSPKKTENPYIDPRAFKPHGTCEFERRKNKEEENKLQKASLGIAFGRVKKPPKVVLPVTSVSEIGKEVARVIGGDYTARGVAKAINAMHGYEQLPDEYKELAIEYFAESFRAFFSVKRYVDLEADAKGAICQRLFGYAIYLAKQSSDLDDKYAKHEDRDPLSTVSDPRKRSGKKKSALLDRRPQEIGIAYRNYLGVKDKVIKITDQKGLTQIDINERDIILSSFEKELPSLLDCEGLMVDAAANILQESLVDIILDKNLRQNLLNAFQINYIERVRSLIHC